jgi:uncharacterized membrane protein
MRGMSGLAWLLPISSIGFLAFVGTAVYGAIWQDWSAWLLMAVALPGIPFVWLGLMIALMDVTRRPNDHVSDEARMIWTAVICILNVFAFPVYWAVVVRNSPPLPEPAPKAKTPAASSGETAETSQS